MIRFEHPYCCPELALLSSVSSAGAREMRPLMSSSQGQVRGVQVAVKYIGQHKTLHSIRAWCMPTVLSNSQSPSPIRFIIHVSLNFLSFSF